MIGGSSWIILSIILATCNSSDDHHCLQKWKCDCSVVRRDKMLLNCPTNNNSDFRVTIHPYSYIKVKCKSHLKLPKLSLFNLSPLGEINELSFDSCDLPMNSSLGEIARSLGLDHVEKLTFWSFNMTQTLTKNHLKGLRSLKHLYLGGNKFSSFFSDLFVDVPQLVLFYLQGNKVYFSRDTFKNTPELEILDLSGNMMRHIDPLLFAPLTKLQSLILGKNNFKRLRSASYKKSVSLKSLDPSSNDFMELSEDIFLRPENLKMLHFFNVSFNSLPRYLLGDTLSETNRNYNTKNMTLFRILFPSLMRQQVKINDNGSITMPETVTFQYMLLDDVNAEKNNLESLHERIFEKLRYLSELSLSHNRLVTLPNNIFSHTTSLKSLDLSYNRLTSISRHLFENLKSLVILRMEGNQLREIDHTSFTSLRHLEFATFQNNQLTFPSCSDDGYGKKSPFYNCSNLEKLNLANNSISRLCDDWIRSLSLRQLNLESNKINYISTRDLQFLSTDIEVDLKYNEIRHIYLSRAEEVSKHQRIERKVHILIGNNPIKCDCNLYDLLRYLKKKMHRYVYNYFQIIPGNLTCHGPKWTNKMSVIQLDLRTFLCQSESESCVNKCSCWIKQNSKSLLIDCSLKSLTSISRISHHNTESNFTENRTRYTSVNESSLDIEIQCQNHPPWPKSHFLDLFPKDDTELMYFRMCDLPLNSSLDAITNNLETKNIENLIFQSFDKLNDSLTRNSLKGFPNLRKLILSGNGITGLNNNLFADVPHLVWLDLQQNNVHLTRRVFKNTPKLEVLLLANNMINRIEPHLFDLSTGLKTLDLSGNNLTKLKHGTFHNLIFLTSLNLNSNNLTTLSKNIFEKLEHLQTLSLCNNSFNSLPGDLLKHNVKLKNVNLCDDKKNMSLPERFFPNLLYLEVVNLKGNGLIAVPENLFSSSTTLKNISLENNCLESLPGSLFHNLDHLLELKLGSNRLSWLPHIIFSTLRDLVRLDLSRNRFTHVPSTLDHTSKSLKILDMKQNQLQTLDSKTCQLLKMARIVILSENQLTFWNHQETYFEECVSLEELHLDRNNITEIYGHWFDSNSKLRLLNVSYNNIPYISLEDLEFSSNNVKVDLRNNKIQHIHLNKTEEQQTYRDIGHNVEILIEHNPIICDCNIYDFLRYMDRRVHSWVQNYFRLVPGNLTCHGPTEAYKVPVETLNSTSFKCQSSDHCPKECSCWKKRNDKTLLVDCSYRNLTKIPRNIEAVPDYDLELNFTGNRLTTVSPLAKIDLNNVSVPKLLLANNDIKNLFVEELPKDVEILQLHNNNIDKLTSDVLRFFNDSTTLTTLTLHGNPWSCDCDATDFLKFIQTEIRVKILNLSMIECKGIKAPMFKMSVTDLCSTNTVTIIGTSFVIGLLGLIIGILVALYYRYQREIMVWLYAHQFCLWLVTEHELDKGKTYDAFISYSHKDEEFVVNELVKKLEDGPRPFKLCIHIRDWLAGEYIPTQIIRSVENSKRTIVVLSSNFIESVWGRMELKAAHCQALSEGRTRVIMILYGDIEPITGIDPDLKAYLNMNTYIKWGDPWFWDKLRYALPHSPQSTRKHARRIDFPKTIMETTT